MTDYAKTYAQQSCIQQGGLSALNPLNTSPPPQPTRFSMYAGHLEDRVVHVMGLVDRVSRVADRLGGSVPEEAHTGGKVRGNGGNGGSVASQIENSLEDFDVILKRAEHTIERLEQL